MTAADKTAGRTLLEGREELARLEKLAKPHLMPREAGALLLRRRGFFDDRLGFSEEYSVVVGARRSYATFQIPTKTVDTRETLSVHIRFDLRCTPRAISDLRRDAVETLRLAGQKSEAESQEIQAAMLLPEKRS